MDVKYVGNDMYQVEISDFQYTIGCENIMKCKQRFLEIISRQFDDAVNEKLGDIGLFNEFLQRRINEIN